MAKFAVVSKAPEKLEKGEIIIGLPDFMEQIQLNSRKAPKNKQTGINHLREVVNSIAQAYDPEFSVYKVPMYKYEGINYTTDKDFSDIVVNLFKNEHPKIFEKYTELQLKNRPLGTKLVYYVGNFADTGAFYHAGLDHIELKDIESYMTGKPKKVVGKPALTKEEALAASSETVSNEE